MSPVLQYSWAETTLTRLTSVDSFSFVLKSIFEYLNSLSIVPLWETCFISRLFSIYVSKWNSFETREEKNCALNKLTYICPRLNGATGKTAWCLFELDHEIGWKFKIYLDSVYWILCKCSSLFSAARPFSCFKPRWQASIILFFSTSFFFFFFSQTHFSSSHVRLPVIMHNFKLSSLREIFCGSRGWGNRITHTFHRHKWNAIFFFFFFWYCVLTWYFILHFLHCNGMRPIFLSTRTTPET